MMPSTPAPPPIGSAVPPRRLLPPLPPRTSMTSLVDAPRFHFMRGTVPVRARRDARAV